MTTLPQTTQIRVARPIQPASFQAPAIVSGQGSVSGSTAGGGLTPNDLMRVLRANLWLIVLAVIAGGIAGYVLNGYMLKNYPKYRASGFVTVRSPLEMPEIGQRPDSLRPEEIVLLQETHCKTIMHETLFVDSISIEGSKIRSTSWFDSFKNERDPLAAMKKDLRDNLVAAAEARSRLLRVEMTTAVPIDGKIIVEELVDVYVKSVNQKQRESEQNQMNLLQGERRRLQFELDEEVTKQLHAMETELGVDGVEIYSAYSGKRMLLDRMLQERARVNSELAGINSQMKGLDKDVTDGRTPAEVQQMLSRDGSYLQAKQRLNDLDIEIDLLRGKLSPEHDLVVAMSKRRLAYQQKLDEIREELRSDYAETFRTTLRNSADAMTANGAVIKQEVDNLGRELGRLNVVMEQYRLLKQRESSLRTKVAGYDQEIRRVAQFRIGQNWSQAEWSSKPQQPDSPSFPKLPVTMALAVMGALGLSLGIAFLREITDTSVRSPRDIAKVGQLNLLGLIPHQLDDPQAAGGRFPLAIFDAPNSHAAEQFRQIRTRLQYAHSLDTTRSLLVTSASAQDGKTSVACNLAASLALNGRRILLVDANFRRPQLHSIFSVPNENGFGDALCDLSKLSQCIRETDVPNLSVLVSGTKPANPTELLESQFFIDFIEESLKDFDHVIFDSGPLLMVSESVAMAPRVDGVVTVVRAGGNSRGLLTRLREELRRVKAEHMGVVLNAVRSQGGGYYGRNIKSYYAYQNAE